MSRLKISKTTCREVVKLLLDTHAFLWYIEANPKLSQWALELIHDADNNVALSIASLWEMTIKASLGKLELKLPLTEFVEKRVYGNDIELLAIAPTHLDALRDLPFHHRDPFDRLIIAQAITEGFTIVSQDGRFSDYTVKIAW